MTAFTRHSFKTLDGMRGVAAIAVLLYHSREFLGLPVFKAGYLAVDLFFCLSGFVVAYAYEQRLKAGMPLARFLRIRIARFWPLIALGVVLGASMVATDPAANGLPAGYVPMVVLSLLIIPFFSGANATMFPINFPEWSLFYELAINIVYAALIRLFTNAVIVAVLILAYLTMAHGILKYGTANIGWSEAQLLYGAARVFYSFFVGVGLFRLRGRLIRPGRFSRSWIVLLMTMLALAVPAPGGARPYFDCLFVLIGAPLLVWWGANVEPERRLTGAMTILGETSYALYTLHFPCLLIVRRIAAGMPGIGPEAGALLLAAVIPLSYVAARYYDAPMRRLLSRLLKLRVAPDGRPLARPAPSALS